MTPDFKFRVVLVEDSKAILRLLSETFGDRGYEIFGFLSMWCEPDVH